MSDVITIGIAGGTGSGKTTITRRILDEFGGDVSVLYHDNYYKRHDDIPFPERKKLNYDHPNAFDTPLLVQHLDALRAGQAIECPTYDYTVHNRAAETITVTPAKVIVVEGILIFAEPELRERLDIKLFVDAKFENNVILTKTEFLTMNTRPKNPANARNLNACIIGSSGSGKTRFWLTPQLLQAHSSYAVSYTHLTLPTIA